MIPRRALTTGVLAAVLLLAGLPAIAFAQRPAPALQIGRAHV